jgi:hypothetical protein
VATQRVVPELVAHHTIQSVEAFAHVDCVHAEVDARRWTKAEHSYTRSATLIRCGKSAIPHSIRRPFGSTSWNRPAPSDALLVIFTRARRTDGAACCRK